MHLHNWRAENYGAPASRFFINKKNYKVTSFFLQKKGRGAITRRLGFRAKEMLKTGSQTPLAPAHVPRHPHLRSTSARTLAPDDAVHQKKCTFRSQGLGDESTRVRHGAAMSRSPAQTVQDISCVRGRATVQWTDRTAAISTIDEWAKESYLKTLDLHERRTSTSL